MMNEFKKVLAVLMAVLFVMLCGCQAKVTRPPRIKVDQSGSFAYEALTNGTLKIHVYNERDVKYGVKRVNIPSEIDGQKITRIRKGTFDIFCVVTSIRIPDSITEIEDDAFKLCNKLELIEVDKNNKNYVWEDGALFDKENKIIKFIRKKR